MFFYDDSIAWIGGFPYACASKREISQFGESWGVRLSEFVPTEGWAGYYGFVYKNVLDDAWGCT